MRQAWVKHPTDLHVALRALTRGVRGTFYGLFELARREEPFVGFLVDERGRPVAWRRLAAELGVRPASLRSDREILVAAHLLWLDLSDRYFIPLVIRAAQRFPTPAPKRNHDDEARHDREDVGSGKAVDNGHQLTLGWPPGGTPTAQSAQPASHQELAEEKELELRTAWAVENFERWQWEDLIPASIDDPTARFQLSKLADASPARWGRMLRVPRDLAALEQMFRDRRRELLEALTQASYDHGSDIRKPAAWLLRTTATLAEERAS
jgi:hypothetical protein